MRIRIKKRRKPTIWRGERSASFLLALSLFLSLFGSFWWKNEWMTFSNIFNLAYCSEFCPSALQFYTNVFSQFFAHIVIIIPQFLQFLLLLLLHVTFCSFFTFSKGEELTSFSCRGMQSKSPTLTQSPTLYGDAINASLQVRIRGHSSFPSRTLVLMIPLLPGCFGRQQHAVHGINECSKREPGSGPHVSRTKVRLLWSFHFHSCPEDSLTSSGRCQGPLPGWNGKPALRHSPTGLPLDWQGSGWRWRWPSTPTTPLMGTLCLEGMRGRRGSWWGWKRRTWRKTYHSHPTKLPTNRDVWGGWMAMKHSRERERRIKGSVTTFSVLIIRTGTIN